MSEEKEKYPIPENDMFLLLGLLGSLKAADYDAIKESLRASNGRFSAAENSKFFEAEKDSAYDIFWTKLTSMGLANQAPSESFRTIRYALTDPGRKAVLVSTAYLLAGEWPHWKAVIGADVLKILETYINEGDTRSAVKLGELLLKKQGEERNVSKAFDLFTRAANQNDARGVYQLGLMYVRGDHVAKDPDLALELVHKAESLGETDALFALFGMYTGATGGKLDKTKVFEYLDKAVVAKHPMAMRELGRMYASGKGKPQDNLKAYILLTLALANFVNTSADREAVGKRMTPPEWQIGDEIVKLCAKRKDLPKALL